LFVKAVGYGQMVTGKTCLSTERFLDQSENKGDSFLVRHNSIYPSVGLTLGPLFFTIPLVAGIILSRPIPYNPYFKSPVLISVIRVDKWVGLPCY
jgi:hypothetical protein